MDTVSQALRGRARRDQLPSCGTPRRLWPDVVWRPPPAGVIDAPAAAFVLEQQPNMHGMWLIGNQICQQMRTLCYLLLARRDHR